MYTAEVTCLSPKATVKNVYDFFARCGAIEHVEIISCGDYASTAYVTFRCAYALETAILHSGAKIVDQPVFITHWGAYADGSQSSVKAESYAPAMGLYMNQYASTPGEAVTVAQQVVKTTIAKGYILGKDALVKAKAFDQSYKVSATTAAKVAELSDRIGLTEKIQESMRTVKSVDEKYHLSHITASAILVTGTAAMVTATYAIKAVNAIANSSYFANGGRRVLDVLILAAQAAADFGSNKGSE